MTRSSILRGVVVFLLAVALFLISDRPQSLLTSSTLYVSPIGNDTNPGTIYAPLRTIAKALTIIADGGRIVVRAGTYPAVKITRSNISLVAYSGEAPRIDGGITLDNVSQVLVDGFEVINADGDGIYRLGGVLILGGSHNTVQNNIVHHNVLNETNGIKVQDSSSNHILNNAVYDNGGVGIRVIGSFAAADYNEIGYNKVYGNILDGGNADGIGLIGNVSYTYIHHNDVCCNGDDAIDVWNSHYNIITDNVAHDQILNDGNGLKLGWGGDNTITNNVAYGNKYRGFSSNGGGGNYYLSNISYNNGWCGLEDSWRVTGDTRVSFFENNQAYNNGQDFCLGVYSVVIVPTLETVFPTLARTPLVATATPCRLRPRKRC